MSIPSEENASPAVACLYPSKKLTFLLGGMILLLALQSSILTVLLLRSECRDRAVAPVAVAGDSPQTWSLSPEATEWVAGPWGEIEISEIVVSPPRNVFMYDYGDVQSHWVLPDCPLAHVEEYLLGLGVPADVASQLKNASSTHEESKGTVVRPSKALVWSLTAEVRATLYSHLAQFKQNPIQKEPFRFRSENFDDWFADSGVSESLVGKVRQLSYRHDGYWLFSDLGLMWPLVDSPFAWTRFLQTLYQEQAVSLRLRVPRGEDTASLASYWGSAGDLPQLDPVLNTAKRGGDTVEIVFLLPPFARTRLNTYVNPSNMRTGTVYNCHWATLNFFSENPNDQFGKTEVAADFINANCSVVTGDPRYGDICAIVDKSGKLVHSCTYIAADIVFTKNGDAVFAPFVLDRLQHVRALYSFYGGVKMVVVRPKAKRA